MGTSAEGGYEAEVESPGRRSTAFSALSSGEYECEILMSGESPMGASRKGDGSIFKALVFVLVLISFSCQDEYSHGVFVRNQIKHISISNQTSVSTYYAAFEREILARINWAPVCSEKNEIKPFGVGQIPITEDSFKPSNQAVVFWWSECSKNESGISRGVDIQGVVVQVR